MLGFLVTLFSIVWLVGSILAGLFFLWKKMRLERITQEEVFVDCVLGAGTVAVVLSSLLVWLATQVASTGIPVEVPSVSRFIQTVEPFSIVIFLIGLWWLTKKEWKDRTELLDFVVVPLSAYLACLAIGQVVVTALSYGLSYTQQTPLSFHLYDLYWVLPSIFFVIITMVLAHFERTYRTFLWYRYKRSSAQTGFVLAVFLMLYGLFGATVGWLQPSVLKIATIPVEPILSLLVMVAGFVILYVRSGRAGGKR